MQPTKTLTIIQKGHGKQLHFMRKVDLLIVLIFLIHLRMVWCFARQLVRFHVILPKHFVNLMRTTKSGLEKTVLRFRHEKHFCVILKIAELCPEQLFRFL